MKVFLLSARVYICIFSLLLCAYIPPAIASEGQVNSLYFAMDKPFVVNLSGSNSLTYLQVCVQFRLKKTEFRAKLRQQLPAIENTMVMLLSNQTVARIKSVQGKLALRQKALKSVQQVCKKLIGNPTIDDVYFTKFIIQ